MSDSAIQRLRREEQMAVADEVRANILFIKRHGYPRNQRPRQYTSPPKAEVVHRDEDPDDDDADDIVGARRPFRGIQEEPPGIRVRRNDPQPQGYVVQEQHRRNAPPYNRRSPCFTPTTHSLNRHGQRVALLAIEGRTRALRQHREMIGPVIIERSRFPP